MVSARPASHRHTKIRATRTAVSSAESTLVTLLRRRMQQTGWSTERVAKHLDIAHDAFLHVLSGTTVPNGRTLERYARYLRLDASDLRPTRASDHGAARLSDVPSRPRTTIQLTKKSLAAKIARLPDSKLLQLAALMRQLDI